MFNKKTWLKIAALLLLSSQSFTLFAGAQAPAALAGLLAGTSFTNSVPLPPLGDIKVPEAVFEKVSLTGAAPAPGKDFSPLVEDKARIKAIMKLITDIGQGAHLPYAQDGAVFSNKEGRLPAQPRGFYKEYTLLTGSAPHVVVIGGTTYQVAPDLSARGSERVIIGGGEKIYYTPDHYAHFILLTVVY